MSAPARRVIFFALVVGLLTLGIVIVPAAEAVNGALSVDSPTAVTEPQGSRKVVFTLSLERDAGNDDTVRVDYSATPGTATAYQDFIPDVDGTAIFDDSETTQTVSIDVLGDALDEEDETFTLVLSNAQASDGPDPDSNPEGTATIAAGIGTATILDDDGPPRVSIGGATVEEGDAGDVTARFSVALSSPSARPVSVTWATADGTATAGQDYEPDGGSLSFPPGEVSQVVRVTVAGDTLDELDEETFMVGLSEPTNVDLGPAAIGTGRILDDDGPPALSVSDASGAEGGQVDFTVTLSKESGRPVTVSAVTTGVGSASPNLDYGATSASIRFEPGETSKTFSVSLRTDGVDEGDETFQAVISGAEAAAIDNAAGTGTIADTNPGPELSIGDVRVPEGDTASTLAFEVTLSQTPSQLVTVNYAASDGTARTVEDYVVNAGTLTFLPGTTTLTQPVAVGLAGDDLAELSETFVVRLSNPTGGATLAAGKGQATATIDDDDGAPAKVSVANSGPGAEGGTAQFSVTLERAVPEPVTVSYTIRDEGTARAGEDYQLRAGTVEFAPNETSKQIVVPIQADSRDEVDETFTLVLSNPIDAEIGTGTATGSITDDDEPPVISMDTLDLEEGNESPSSGDVVVRLTPASGQTVTVAYAIGPDGDADPENDAVAGQDYQAEANGVITFPAGADLRRISVDALPDGLDELPERFLIALSGPTNATLGTTPDALVTIEDGDASPIVSISAPDPVVEPKDNREVQTIFSLTLSAVSGLPVFITYATTDGSARDADGDYVGGGPVTQIISPGRLGASISIPVKGDGQPDDEPIEDFSVTISGPDNARLPVDAGGTTATAVILDVDGEPTLSVFDARVPEGDGAGVVRPLIRLVPPAPTDVTVQLATADDSAGAPDDYAGVDGATVAFAAGRTVPNAESAVSVAVVGDLDDEATEQFEVILSPGTATAVPVAREAAMVSIVDDDGPEVSVGDVSVTEGDGATTAIAFEITLSKPSVEPVSVDYATAAGTATAGDDFESLQARTLDFDAGETVGTVTVEVLGDLADEPDETFTLGLSNAVNADVGRSLAVATILDNDQPVLVMPAAGSADPPFVFETDLDAPRVVFTLVLQSPAGFVATRESSVAYATTSTRAVVGGDFLPASGRVTFAPGETTKTVVVSVLGDSLDEPDETVNLALTDPVNLSLPASTVGTILDDDKAGYFMVATDGGIFTFGDAGFYGSTGSVKLNQPIVGAAAHPSGRGYWLVAADGGVFTFGEAGFYGSTGAIKLNRPIVGMAPTPTGKGYWLVATDGGIFAFGDAAFRGSTGAIRLNKPVAGMAPTPTGQGYWLVATDGGIFAFGDARFFGSTGNITLNQPIVGMASTTGGQGYWLVATDGGVFTFGDAKFLGSTGAVKLNRPIVGMAPTPSGNGYWLVADDGGIFTFGDAEFLGSTGNIKLNKPVVGMAVL